MGNFSSFDWDSSGYTHDFRFFSEEKKNISAEDLKKNSSFYDTPIETNENLSESEEAVEESDKISKNTTAQTRNPHIESQKIHQRMTKENLMESEDEFYLNVQSKLDREANKKIEYEVEVDRCEARYKLLREKLKNSFRDLLKKIQEGHP